MAYLARPLALGTSINPIARMTVEAQISSIRVIPSVASDIPLSMLSLSVSKANCVTSLAIRRGT